MVDYNIEIELITDLFATNFKSCPILETYLVDFFNIMVDLIDHIVIVFKFTVLFESLLAIKYDIFHD